MPEHDSVDPETARRIQAAFTALATTEVPVTAPRPGAAPRPVATAGRVTRRRFGIAGAGLLVAAAAVVVAVLVSGEVQQATPRPSVPAGPSSLTTTAPATAAPTSGSVTSSPSSPSTEVSTGASTPVGSGAERSPTLAEATTAFAAVSNGTRSSVVQVPGGFEAADLTGSTGIRLWTSTDGTGWTTTASSTYPPPFSPAGLAGIKVAGLPTGSAHAVFVVDDQGATGDSTGIDVAFGGGPDAFGAIKGAADGDLHLSGEGVTQVGDIGGSYAADLQDGLLVTQDCVLDNVGTQCDNRVTKTWRWNGEVFTLVTSS